MLSMQLSSPVLSTSSHLLLGMIGTADERSRFDVAKAESKTFGFERGEFIRVVEPCDGEVFFCRLQILSDRHDVAFNRAEVAHGGVVACVPT